MLSKDHSGCPVKSAVGQGKMWKMSKDHVRREIPKIQARVGGGLEHSSSRGGINDQILVLEVMPTALANGLAMGSKRKR